MSIEIWMEGFAATGQIGTAQKIWEGEADSFDQAVEKYILTRSEKEVQDYGPSRYTRDNFTSDEAYNNRKSDWNIWACALFDNEKDARRSFG